MKEKLYLHCLKWMQAYLNCREHFFMEEWMSDLGCRMSLLQILISMKCIINQ